MYLDYYYFILIVPVLIISLIAQARVNSAYNRFSRVQNRRGLTGAMAAQAVLDFYGVQGVRIEHVRGKLNDHYDPRSNVIRLSDGVYGSCSIAAVGVGSQFLINFGIILYATVMLFQLCTLPVEFNASRRALSVIENTGLLGAEESGGAQKVLRAAAMTYVAAFAMSAANLLRLILLSRNRRD